MRSGGDVGDLRVPVSGGRADALASLFRAQWAPLTRLAGAILADRAAAEEVVMDAFVKVASGWQRFSGVERQEAYLHRAVINLCRSRLRRKTVEARFAHRESSVSRADSRTDASVENRLDVMHLIGRLPPRQRLLIALRYAADMTEEQIADELSLSLGGVKSQLSKARQTLKSFLAQEGVDRRER